VSSLLIDTTATDTKEQTASPDTRAGGKNLRFLEKVFRFFYVSKGFL